MTAQSRMSANMVEAGLRAAERGLVDPLAGTVALRNAIACLSRFGDDYRRAMAEGGEVRRVAQDGARRLQRRIVSDVLPALAEVFDAAALGNWQTRARPDAVEAVTPLEAAALLGVLAPWQRASDTGTEAGALTARICAQMTTDAKARVARFKTLQSPVDSPDYRAVAADLVALEAMIRLAGRLGHRHALEEIVRLRDHYAKTALLSALDVIDRGSGSADMFAHFDIAAMLVSVEHVVVVISRTLDVVERERQHAHPHVETISEHVARDFAAGLMRLAPNYVRMLKNTASGPGSAVPEFGFSILRVLLQIDRLIRILYHYLHDDRLAEATSKIAADVADLRGKLLQTVQNDPDLLARMREALNSAPAEAPGASPRSNTGADQP